MTALYIPALLPMVPGIYAYKTVFSLIMFLQSLNDPGEGLPIHAAVLPQRDRIAERDRAAGSGGYAAHLRIQPPGILAHAAPPSIPTNNDPWKSSGTPSPPITPRPWPVQILLTLVAATLTLLLYLRPTPGVRIAMKTFMALLNFWIAGVYYLLYGEQREHNDMLALFWAIMGCIWVYDLS